ncbi:MAG: phosphoenolpyruvate--protein phosphotransferase [Clostridiales bacterium]|nr:phosphoenolpyruvate--protein phosphotransferase [Clostridiales bacterium]
MILLQGNGVSKGAVCGPLQFYPRQAAAAPDAGADLAAEQARLTWAQEQTAEQLEGLAAACRANGEEEAALLLEAQALLATDEDVASAILAALEESHCSAAYAVQQAGRRLAARFASMSDPYLRARAADLEDVTRRLLDNLTGGPPPVFLREPVILAADDLAPSELLRLERGKLLGLATCGGSGYGHTAILARSMGIPFVCGLGRALTPDCEGQTACLDGETGRILIDPDARTVQAFEFKRNAPPEASSQQEPQNLGSLKVYCNISTPDEAAAVLACGGQGVGLFRSEGLFLSADRCPTEEEQFSAYRAVAEAMGGRPAVIRTLDLGGDKRMGSLPSERGQNPALGLRGIRLSLERPELLRTQLRALYRASAYGKIAILFPMIASMWELEECQRRCRSVMAELTAEGLPFDPEVRLGVMLETPASILLAEELARRADFCSVGTNDLTQYLLACDRQNGDLARYFDPKHPALLRALELAADAAHRAGVPIGVCGELGADPTMLPFFLKLGMDALSVPPQAVGPLLAALRGGSKATECESFL